VAAGKRAGIRGLAHLLRELLRDHRQLEVPGLGEFHSNETGDFCFGGARRPAVFVSYASEDRKAAEEIASRLNHAGFSAWLDKRRLRPGDSWLKTIEDAIDTSDFFIACLSRRSLKKRGTFQRELRMAMDCARNVPLDETYFVPVRLDDCPVPRAIRNEWQYIDLFPDFGEGMRSVIAALAKQWEKKAA
jgi:hypothetical protein